ncbi:hypothetical protein [Halorussus caseinilyticus]|uniref:Uncharacterized protein n=1 Tax=Halorussus caseinilyticus TaxID=3034025 RepID=A0ABD5WKV3_9EURY
MKVTLLMFRSEMEWSTLMYASGSVSFESVSVGVFSAIGFSLDVTFSVRSAFRVGVTLTDENDTLPSRSSGVETLTDTGSFALAFRTVTFTFAASAGSVRFVRSVAFEVRFPGRYVPFPAFSGNAVRFRPGFVTFTGGPVRFSSGPRSAGGPDPIPGPTPSGGAPSPGVQFGSAGGVSPRFSGERSRSASCPDSPVHPSSASRRESASRPDPAGHRGSVR